MFTKHEILKLKQYCQEIINAPMYMEEQPHKREGKYLWCMDWEIIEILKYLFNGRSMYALDPPPNRLKNNPLWSKEDISRKAELLIESSDGAEVIIQKLRSLRSESNRTASGIS